MVGTQLEVATPLLASGCVMSKIFEDLGIMEEWKQGAAAMSGTASSRTGVAASHRVVGVRMVEGPGGTDRSQDPNINLVSNSDSSLGLSFEGTTPGKSISTACI